MEEGITSSGYQRGVITEGCVFRIQIWEKR